jgi:hypothetical protein
VTAACLLGLRVRIQPRAWKSVVIVVFFFKVCQADLSSRGVLVSVVRFVVIVKPPYCGGSNPLALDPSLGEYN